MVLLSMLQGQNPDSEQTLAAIRTHIFPPAVALLNSQTLPLQVALFGTDVIPENQRNLTDVRTRVGILLEYELGKAIHSLLPPDVAEAVSLTYVVANKFPDLAFRTRAGGTGIRFEVKSIEIVAEEKAANFDTLVKDIRKGTDFVVVMVWGWQKHADFPLRYPHVYAVFVFDAYDLALMRDCYWLNNPPGSLGIGRQGFDLTYAVNCRQNAYNREEGNYGKLMRIFERSFESMLPAGVAQRTTLSTYYEFTETTVRLGITSILNRIAAAYAGADGATVVLNAALPVSLIAENRFGDKLLLVGDDEMPRIAAVRTQAAGQGARYCLVLNGKFAWRASDVNGDGVSEARKPGAAVRWAEGLVATAGA